MTDEHPDPDGVAYSLVDGVATITLDDGKANVMTIAFMEAIADAFDRAEADEAVVLVEGRAGIFSGGFDLAMFQRDIGEILATLRTGGNLVHRILGHPFPVVIAAPGHAVAQGAFVLLAGDVRVGVHGDARIGLNEVAIGLTMPLYGVETARQRLAPAWFNHALTTGTLYSPTEALDAGFLDRLVSPDELEGVARREAERLTAIDMTAHAGTKQRARAPALRAIRAGVDEEFPA